MNGKARDPRELFVTPDWAIDAILPRLPLDGTIVEPGAGNGAIVRRLLTAGVKHENIEASEIVRARAAKVRRLGVRCRRRTPSRPDRRPSPSW